MPTRRWRFDFSWPVHPHAGGECRFSHFPQRATPGSPPRGWGMPFVVRMSSLMRRFTPTRVGNALAYVPEAEWLTVHPHAGGECDAAVEYGLRLDGSPPRGWGMRLDDLRHPRLGRFTPTRVGNAILSLLLYDRLTVHPHAGGECLLPQPGDVRAVGSPPRGWGMQMDAINELKKRRFTPTRVGNALWMWLFRSKVPVHPHAGGECKSRLLATCGHRGSPPRGWGMRKTFKAISRLDRFTPTRVGNARNAWGMVHFRSVHPHAGGECASPARRSWPHPVHPHAGGECLDRLRLDRADPGSPPRGWGMLRGRKIADRVWRFTPTRVGNAPAQIAPVAVSAVHPHAGGECAHSPASADFPDGSPPRGWGMQSRRDAQNEEYWFTPTRVGNARIRRTARPAQTVHPHAGGECSRWQGEPSTESGSPPRGWGMPGPGLRLDCPGRFTPTRVGNALFNGGGVEFTSVHPHAGGECGDGALDEPGVLGSPPRGWGMHRRARAFDGPLRFTPTRVGNAGPATGVSWYAPVHPHAGGECGRDREPP